MDWSSLVVGGEARPFGYFGQMISGNARKRRDLLAGIAFAEISGEQQRKVSKVAFMA